MISDVECSETEICVLQKQLNRRLERRVALLMEEELDEQGVQLYHSEPEEWQVSSEGNYCTVY